jgi:hypothetical protein
MMRSLILLASKANACLIVAILGTSSMSLATDRYVNATYANSDGISTFLTVTAAVQASQPGDRVVIEPGVYNEGALTLPHSLVLMPTSSGAFVDLQFNVSFTYAPNNVYELFGMRLGQYGFYAANGGSIATRTLVHFIDCSATMAGFEHDGWDIHFVRSTMTTAHIRHGDAVLSSFTTFRLRDEGGTTISSRQLNFVQNSVSSELWIVSDNAHFRIANNSLKHLYIQGWHTSASIRNDIVNNLFNGGTIHVSFQGTPRYNLRFINNHNTGGVNHCDGGHWNCEADFLAECPAGCDGGPLGFDCNIPGYFEWSYNSWTPAFSCEPNAAQSLVFRKIIPNVGDIVNGGNPSHEFYDTDMTVNDRGRAGGTWGTSNFPETAPGSAYIYNLEMPSDLYPGIPATMKAKGFQRH